jgi:hypothetical protein
VEILIDGASVGRTEKLNLVSGFGVRMTGRLDSYSGEVEVRVEAQTTCLDEAEIWLDARNVRDYEPGTPWRNQGTAGSAYDAAVSDDVTPEFVNDWESNGPAFHIPSTEADKFGVGFVIPDGLVTQVPAGGSRTIVVDTTPQGDVTGQRFAWRYEESSLPVSVNGWVMENADVSPGVPKLIVSGFDGVDWTGGRATQDLTNRQIVVLMFDGTDVSGFTNGNTAFDDVASTAQADLGAIDEPGDVYIGSGQYIHSFVVWDRALSDAELASLPYVLR